MNLMETTQTRADMATKPVARDLGVFQESLAPDAIYSASGIYNGVRYCVISLDALSGAWSFRNGRQPKVRL